MFVDFVAMFLCKSNHVAYEFLGIRIEEMFENIFNFDFLFQWGMTHWIVPSDNIVIGKESKVFSGSSRRKDEGRCTFGIIEVQYGWKMTEVGQSRLNIPC